MPPIIVRELLSFYKYDGDNISIIRGSALAAVTDSDTKIGRDAIMELMEAVEATIETPVRELDKSFLMPVEDTFSIAGRGTVATGRVETGIIKVGDQVDIIGITKAPMKTSVTGTAMCVCVCVCGND